jgi:NAD(P)-dependent dehydrogenase (short-subunit alcohol dehydrogenase family)
VLTGRVFVITGATGALGGLAARTFAGQGASLALLSNNPAKLQGLKEALKLPEARLLSLNADLRNSDSVGAAAETVLGKFGRLDGLIHLVGGWTGGKTIPQSGQEDFESMLGQHAWTTFHLFHAFAPALAANGWGRVMVVSVPFAARPLGKNAAYAAAKAAQENLVLSLAAELNADGVTANIIEVKSIDAEGTGKGTPPAEIVAAMLYLCSDEAGRVNGARLPLHS